MVDLDFDFGFADELTLLREQTRRFAAERIAPFAAEIDAQNRFPRELWPEIGALGLFGVAVDEALGGAGLGYLAEVVAVEELSRASAAVGLSYAVHSQLCVNQIAQRGTPEQQRRFLPKLLSGEHVGALAMSEVNAGSDVLGMRTTAVPDGDGYILDGTKMWITNGPQADVLIVYARLADEHGSGNGSANGQSPKLKAFIVERTLPGFTADAKLDKLGMRGSDTSGLVFNRCRIPASHVLAGDGKEIMMSGLDYERVVLAGGALGIMRACLDVTLPYVHARKQFDRPIGSFELMQGKLADMYTTMNASRAFVYAVAAACDRGHKTRFDSAAAILKASEGATWMAGQTIQALGGNGYTTEYPAGRLWRDAKLYEIGAGTNEIRRMLIGRELFAATAETR
ncbi:MAG TPA: acyl-CoA dehydrogenase family protein [Gammaproteobacteria bacterium]|nr:acyl-CoA dehydrogenase family protein [Gammaproteobacteria bacterium]